MSNHKPEVLGQSESNKPLHLAFLHKTATLEPHFTMYRSKSGTDHWWENRVLDF